MDHSQLRLAAAQAKRVEREARVLKQMLAKLRDDPNPQPQEAQDARTEARP